MASCLGLSGFHRRRRPCRRLGPFIQREEDGMVGRVDRDADKVTASCFTPGITRDLECLHPMRLAAVALHDVVHGRGDQARFPCRGPHRLVASEDLGNRTMPASRFLFPDVPYQIPAESASKYFARIPSSGMEQCEIQHCAVLVGKLALGSRAPGHCGFAPFPRLCDGNRETVNHNPEKMDSFQGGHNTT